MKEVKLTKEEKEASVLLIKCKCNYIWKVSPNPYWVNCPKCSKALEVEEATIWLKAKP